MHPSYQQENKMAVKFSETDYWNPAEWVSRTLFTEIVENKIITNTEYEKELKKEIRNCIKSYVWLIDHTNSEPYQLEIFQELIKSANQQIIVPIEYKDCLLYTSPSPRDKRQSRMPSSA